MKYIRFEKDAETHEGKPLYTVLNIRVNEPIAQIFWYSCWQKWCVRFNEDSVWSEDCLADVRMFILKLGVGITTTPERTSEVRG